MEQWVAAPVLLSPLQTVDKPGHGRRTLGGTRKLKIVRFSWRGKVPKQLSMLFPRRCKASFPLQYSSIYPWIDSSVCGRTLRDASRTHPPPFCPDVFRVLFSLFCSVLHYCTARHGRTTPMSSSSRCSTIWATCPSLPSPGLGVSRAT